MNILYGFNWDYGTPFPIERHQQGDHSNSLFGAGTFGSTLSSKGVSSPKGTYPMAILGTGILNNHHVDLFTRMRQIGMLDQPKRNQGIHKVPLK